VTEAAGARGTGAARSAPVAAVYLLALAWLLAKATLFRHALPTDVPPDEPAHASYVAWAAEETRFVPRYEAMRLLDDAGRFGPLSNYLAHPSPYYRVLGAADRLLHGGARPGLDPYVRRLRGVAAPLFLAAAALFLWIGARGARPLAAHAVYAAAVAVVPPLAFVGAAVNNDGLAFLAGGVALLGLARELEGKDGALTSALVGAGLALALLSKATAGLLVSVAVAAVLAGDRRRVPGASRRTLLALLPALALAAFHYVPVLLRYGTPIPSLDVVHPEAFARSALVSAPGGAVLAFPEWCARMLKLLASTGLSTIGHAAVPVGPSLTLAGPALLLALAAAGLLVRSRAGTRDDDLRLARAGAVAFAVTLAANLAWAWRGYLEAGRLGGTHARYFLPLLPCLALAAARGLERLPAPRWAAAALVALLLLFDATVTARALAAL